MRFFEKRFAYEYDRRLTEEGYPGELLAAVTGELPDSGTVLDIGAGSGLFALPLAEKGYCITAIEPSSEMINMFKQKICDSIRNRITIYQTDWESWSGEYFDSIICMHSLYPMRDFSFALFKMKEHADISLLLVRSDAVSSSLYDIIRSKFKIQRNMIHVHEKVRESLDSLGILYKTKDVSQTRIHRFQDLNEEAEYACYHLNLANSQINQVKHILQEITMKEKDFYTFKSEYHDILFKF